MLNRLVLATPGTVLGLASYTDVDTTTVQGERMLAVCLTDPSNQTIS